jgi:PPE-repeat protein
VLIVLLPLATLGPVPTHAVAAVGRPAANTVVPSEPVHRGPVVGARLRDTATLSSGFDPTGTIVFTIYGPDDPHCAGRGTTVGAPVPVRGNGPYQTTAPFIPTRAGTYEWVARYSGDVNNQPAADPCGAERVVIGAGCDKRDDDGFGFGDADRGNFGRGNTGHDNFGDGNRGDGNFGDCNDGDDNFGGFNDGDRNFGDHNDGNDNFGDDKGGNARF